MLATIKCHGWELVLDGLYCRRVLICSEEIKDRLEKQVDLIIHGGYLGQKPTTVIDLTDDTPVVVREGVGDVKPFL